MKKIAYAILALFLLISCEEHEGHNHEGHDHEGHDHGGHEHEGHDHGVEEGHHDGEVILTDNQAESLQIKIGVFQSRKFSELIEVNGELELTPQHIADVHVLIGGVISEIKVVEGDPIKKGQVLASLKHPEIIKIQEELISKSTNLIYLENEYERQKTLNNEEVGSGKEYQKIKSEYLGAKGLVDALVARIELLGLNADRIMEGQIVSEIAIKSPINGRVSLVETNIGEHVSTDKRLFQIVNNTQLHAAFRVYENDILKVVEGQEIVVNSPSLGNQSLEATIYAISPVFEDNPKNVHIQAKFNKPDSRFISGMYVSGKIQTDSLVRVVVPRSAVIIDEGEKFVFVHHEDENDAEPDHEGHDHEHLEEIDHHDEIHFKKMLVKTGIEEGEWIEVLNVSEFPENVEIALNSAYYLQAEIGKGETEHVH